MRTRPFRRALLGWYRRHARDLPWRRTRDPYRIWVAEVMLQQTRVETVLPYYERFLAAFPDARALAGASLDEVLRAWQGLGYYGRAQRLHEACRLVVHERGGAWPREAAEWAGLPGVGRYTAAAVASIAFDEAVPVLDGNVKRVLARVLALREAVDTAAGERALREAAGALLPREGAGTFNQALMELGALVCHPQRPACCECPVRSHCAAHRTGEPTRWPVRKGGQAPLPHYEVVVGMLRSGGRVLLGRRPADGLLGGLWELPGGKVRAGETREEALRRELAEELGIHARVGPLLGTVRHAYSHFRVTLHVCVCPSYRGRPRPRFHTALRWVAPSQLSQYALPAATRRALALLPE